MDTLAIKLLTESDRPFYEPKLELIYLSISDQADILLGYTIMQTLQDEQFKLLK